MSESSLPSNSSQPTQGVPHSANADAIERQSLYEREEAIQNLLSDPSPVERLMGADADLTAAMDVAHAAMNLGALTGEATPHPEDLVVLIQVLNQCNSNLLARVNELEVELAKSQESLKIQAESPDADATSLRTELNQVKLKVMKLRQQMSAAYQANQSHRARIQDLQAQLTKTEQEHAALTEAHVQLQDQFQAQSQRLVEAENTCRDLCLRLHRQQQYTLQFKAALKARSSLGISETPGAEVEAVHLRADAVELASKVREIRPWSLQSNEEGTANPLTSLQSASTSESADPQISHEPLPESPSPLIEIADLPNPEAVSDRPSTEDPMGNVLSLDLPEFPAIQQLSAVEPPAEGAESVENTLSNPDLQVAVDLNSEPSISPRPAISFDVKQGLPKWAKFSQPTGSMDLAEIAEEQPAILEPTSSAAMPSITDPWMEASTLDAQGAIAPSEAAIDESPSLAPRADAEEASLEIQANAAPFGYGQDAPTPEIDLDPALLEQLDAAVRPLLDSVVDAIRGDIAPVPKSLDMSQEAHPPAQAQDSEPITPETPYPNGSPLLGQAEEDLWRDLAKLVNISTDDIIQASLSGDFDAFTAIDFDALHPSQTEDHANPAGSDRPLADRPEIKGVEAKRSPVQASRTDTLDLPFSKSSPVSSDSSELESEDANPVEATPSPVVYPNRPPRKLTSISAVDLPSFPRAPSSQPAQA